MFTQVKHLMLDIKDGNIYAMLLAVCYLALAGLVSFIAWMVIQASTGAYEPDEVKFSRGTYQIVEVDPPRYFRIVLIDNKTGQELSYRTKYCVGHKKLEVGEFINLDVKTKIWHDKDMQSVSIVDANKIFCSLTDDLQTASNGI
ncbi:MAG: hypothetical protein GJ680_18345 [Alteromonadaceae bacterium]|nr:hypothetical protein [Alteromonadaceae bacterium]